MNNSPALIVGNLTADPEYGNNGSPRLSFSVACSHSWKNKNDEWEEKPSFFNVVAWRNLAETAADVLEKGVRVIVVGRWEQRTWEDKDGNKRSSVEIVADEIAIATKSIASFERRRGTGTEDHVKSNGNRNARPAQRQIANNEEPW